jgi:hypothetical protein
MQTTPDDPISKEIAKLQKPIAGRRLLSWIFFLLLLLVFLILPVVASIWPAEIDKAYSINMSHYLGKSTIAGSGVENKGAHSVGIEHGVSKTRSVLPTYLGLDLAWNPGNLSNSHQPWANDCMVCHSTPFKRVKDQDCLTCHVNIGDHVSKKIVMIDAIHEVRCATCHREHMGEFGLVEQNKRYIGQDCVACHADIKAVYPDTKTENVNDFATKHPEFRVQVNSEFAKEKLIRIREHSGIPLIDKTSLKFPHDVHLNAAGIHSPDGKVKMECANCHKPNTDGVGFLPVTMKENCQHCHTLSFEEAVPSREVPHGSVSQVLSTLREFYSYVDVNGVPLDNPSKTGPIFVLRPGKPDSVGSFINTPGGVLKRANAAATELFEKTSCVVCHDVTRSSLPGKKGTPEQDMLQWKIAPIPPLHAWMPNVKFEHSKHLSAQCTDCHAAPTSKKASDVLMPDIKECRDCHVGKEPVENKVTSDCGLCHGFHMPSDHPAPALGKAHPLHSLTISPGTKKQ